MINTKANNYRSITDNEFRLNANCVLSLASFTHTISSNEVKKRLIIWVWRSSGWIWRVKKPEIYKTKFPSSVGFYEKRKIMSSSSLQTEAQTPLLLLCVAERWNQDLECWRKVGKRKEPASTPMAGLQNPKYVWVGECFSKDTGKNNQPTNLWITKLNSKFNRSGEANSFLNVFPIFSFSFW